MESSSTSDSERTKSDTETAAPKDDKDQGEVDSSTVTSGVSIPVSDPVKAHEALAGPDPEPMKEDQTGSDSGKLISILYDKPKEDDQDKSKVREESESTIPDPDQTVTSTPPVIAPFIDVSSSKPSLLLRVAYDWHMVFGSEEDDSLLIHTVRFNRRNTCVAGQSLSRIQDLKESDEIIKAKKEQGEEKQDSTYSIRSTDKVDLEEFDLKSALFRHMNKIKSANRNTANYRLYHALMEALITDEDAMDKEVADKVKDHKRKHDSDDDEDDDDDEGPSAGSNQGRSTKRRRSDSAASGSAKPPPKADDQSSKKPRESEASASKQHPTLSSTGWQITDTREAGVDSSMHRSDPESEHSEQSSDDISKQDEGNDSDMEDTDNAHIPKVSTTTWFKPIPESERPATPEPEWTIPPNDFPEPEHNWANAYATTFKIWLEELVHRCGVESDRIYDISAVYGITHWWFRRKEFYINKHSESSDREAVRSHMRILSVISVKVMGKAGQMVKGLSSVGTIRAWSLEVVRGMTKRRSKTSSLQSEKRLQIRRIYRSLESCVGGRYVNIDYMLIKQKQTRRHPRYNKKDILRGVEMKFPVPEMSSVKASQTLMSMYPLYKAQDGDPSQDDVRFQFGAIESQKVVITVKDKRLTSLRGRLLDIRKRLGHPVVAFFWAGHEDTKKLACVKWSNIPASLDKGGLGVGSLKAFNKALLLKWRWRLFQNPNALWVHVVKAIHGDEAGVDLRGCQTNGVWASIVGTINHLHSSGIVPLNSIRFKVSDGSSIRFWNDTRGHLLGVRYPDNGAEAAKSFGCLIMNLLLNYLGILVGDYIGLNGHVLSADFHSNGAPFITEVNSLKVQRCRFISHFCFALEENKEISVDDKMNSYSFLFRRHVPRRNVSLSVLVCPFCDHVLEDSSYPYYSSVALCEDIQVLRRRGVEGLCLFYRFLVEPLNVKDTNSFLRLAPIPKRMLFRQYVEERREDRRCFKCGDPNHFISDCPKNSSGDQKAFVVGSWSDSGDDSKKEEICLMAHSNEVTSKGETNLDEWNQDSWRSETTKEQDHRQRYNILITLSPSISSS
ncbi:RNA-directed DNA polymerase, eukaryota, reverse transcriptase zinc-binding domain protein [Tanacetum coccineum]